MRQKSDRSAELRTARDSYRLLEYTRDQIVKLWRMMHLFRYFFAHVGAVQETARYYVASADGNRFLIDTSVEETAAPTTVVLN